MADDHFELAQFHQTFNDLPLPILKMIKLILSLCFLSACVCVGQTNTLSFTNKSGEVICRVRNNDQLPAKKPGNEVDERAGIFFAGRAIVSGHVCQKSGNEITIINHFGVNGPAFHMDVKDVNPSAWQLGQEVLFYAYELADRSVTNEQGLVVKRLCFSAKVPDEFKNHPRAKDIPPRVK